MCLSSGQGLRAEARKGMPWQNGALGCGTNHFKFKQLHNVNKGVIKFFFLEHGSDVNKNFVLKVGFKNDHGAWKIKTENIPGMV